jgi:predicted dehydrogenase
MATTRWGILGPGRIAHDFARDLRLVPGAELAAVGSRSLPRATSFARELGFAAAYGSYAELLADEGVDAVYVASPHALHVGHVTAALEAGKHVLLEKPLAMTASDGWDLVETARRVERVLATGYQARYVPGHIAMRDLIAEGAIGRVTVARTY